MRRCMRKCKGITVSGAAEHGVPIEAGGGGGVRTRARTRALVTAASAAGGSSVNAAATTGNIRKLVARGRFMRRSSESVEPRSSRRRRRVVIAAEENDLQANSADSQSFCVDDDAKFSSRVSDHGDNISLPASWCSSNSSTAETQQLLVDDPLAVTDPEKDEESHAVAEMPKNSNSISNFRNSRETAPSNESKAESADDGMYMSASNPSSRSTTADKMPLHYEIEEFFAAAEKDIQRRFIERYNFDIVRDVPLEGCYQWVPVKP